jgi:hypothetical protein
MTLRRALAVAAVLGLASPLTVRAGASSTAALRSADVTCGAGLSGALRACAVPAGASVELPAGVPTGVSLRWSSALGGEAAEPWIVRNAGDLQAPGTPGIWRLEASADGKAWKQVGLDLITTERYDGSTASLNGYVIGRHAGAGKGGAYKPPEQFIEVTQDNLDYPVSQSFRLGQFVTKDQRDVWPKYVPLNTRLLDKLERVVQELRKEGFAAKTVHVMSGYRTPRYNGPGKGGRAKFSRHTYGDAADVWVDDDGDGVMDDLNRDGRVDDRDAEYLVAIADRVERRNPELAGGAGIYKATREHGPFTHIDVRGTTARWSRR